MLRLRPSELTLTPEDIDEAFRRIAVKQSSRDSRHVPLQTLTQPGRPVLRRGPQRAVRDAITSLGDIPILRPQPQQGIFSSMDNDIEDHVPQTPSPRQRIDSASTSPARDEQLATMNANTAPPSPLRLLHLPFRLGRGHRDSRTQFLPADNQAGGATTPPTPRTMEDLESASNRHGHGQRTPNTPPATPPTIAELRGGAGGAEKKARTESSGQSVAAPSSSLRRNQSSSRNSSGPPSAAPVVEPTAGDNESMLFLRGYFKDPAKYPEGYNYWFEEARVAVPQTEPRRGSGRLAVPARSLSSGSAPTFSQSASAYRSSSADGEAFPTTAARSSTRPRNRPLSLYTDPPRYLPAAGRQFSSEASASSEAYSLYQLAPESRQISGERPGTPNPSLAQYDGSGSSRYRNSGTYHSVRPSAMRTLSNPRLETLPDPDVGGQHGISPLPSSPYTRTQSHDTTIEDFPVFSSQDAAIAAIQGLASPLEPFSEHYQRLVESNNARLALTAQSYASLHASDSPYSAMEGFTARSLSDRMPPLPPPLAPRPSQIAATSSGAATIEGASALRAARRAHASRLSQRSSENAPMRPPAQSSGPSRNSQVQIHRAAFERLHNAMQDINPGQPEGSHSGPSRRSLPPPAAPRDASNRPRAQGMHPPPPPASRNIMRHRTQRRSSSPNPSPSDQHPHPPAPGDPFNGPPTIPPRHGSNMRGGGPPARSATRALRRVTPIVRSPAQLRAMDQTSTIRSPLLRAATSARPPRRVPAQQRDQENSGAGEEMLMRQEEAAIQARYGEEGQGDTMDETPPRVGRVERRMLG